MAEEAVSSPVARGGRARLVLGSLSLVAMIVLLRTLPVTDWLLAFVAWVQGAGTAGMAGFVAAYVAACVFFLPAFLLTLGAGFVYGVVTGSVPIEEYMKPANILKIVGVRGMAKAMLGRVRSRRSARDAA